MKNQPGTMKNRPPSKSAHFSWLTYTGSQLTFMTQNEKVIIFRYQRRVTTDLHDTEWNEKVLIFRDQRGVTTDLHDTEWNEKVLIFRHWRGVTTDLLDV